jgi:hypothetical protein
MQSGEGCVERARTFLRRRGPLKGLKDLGGEEFPRFLDARRPAGIR